MQLIAESNFALFWLVLGLLTLTTGQETSLQRTGSGNREEIRRLGKKNEELEGQIHELSYSDNRRAGGAAYTRWGRTECPDSASLVYQGYAAGSRSQYAGALAELVCLPLDPEWGRYNDGSQAQAYITGTEYQTSAYGTNQLFLATNANVTSVHGYDVPCAVCFVSGKNTAEMIPAKRSCPGGWSLEYHGYLMSQRHSSPSQIKAVCVDEAPDVLEAGSALQGGASLYHVEGLCASLLCPPYVSFRELTCSVCSR